MDKQFTASEVHERERFEEWYTTHACNYSRDPIGSRDCSLQWESWKAALAAHSAQAQPPAQSKYVPPYPDQSDDWAVVPRVPTKAMIDACCKIKLDRLEALRDGHGASSGIVAAAQEEWAAMIAAAPRKRHDTINLLEDSTEQPPAASVTDAVFPSHRACVPYENHPGKRIVGFVIDESHPWWGKCGLTEPLSALEAALVAQENPNG